MSSRKEHLIPTDVVYELTNDGSPQYRLSIQQFMPADLNPAQKSQGPAILAAVQSLVDVYVAWKQQLKDISTRYYLRVWLFENSLGVFSEGSELVFGGGQSISWYENLFLPIPETLMKCSFALPDILQQYQLTAIPHHYYNFYDAEELDMNFSPELQEELLARNMLFNASDEREYCTAHQTLWTLSAK